MKSTATAIALLLTSCSSSSTEVGGDQEFFLPARYRVVSDCEFPGASVDFSSVVEACTRSDSVRIEEVPIAQITSGGVGGHVVSAYVAASTDIKVSGDDLEDVIVSGNVLGISFETVSAQAVVAIGGIEYDCTFDNQFRPNMGGACSLVEQ